MSELPSLPPIVYDDLVRRALLEDLGRAGDLTTDAIVPADLRGRAALVAREAGRIAGLEPALHAFLLLDPACRAEVRLRDGCDAGAGETIAALLEAAGNSMGRPVWGSRPVAQVMPLTKGLPEMNSPVARSST